MSHHTLSGMMSEIRKEERLLYVQPPIVRAALPFKEIGKEWPEELIEKRAWMMRVLFFDPLPVYERIHLSEIRCSPYKRTNTLFMDVLWPQMVKGQCACGCGKVLESGRRRWASEDCHKFAEDIYWILYGSVERGRIARYTALYYGGDIWSNVCSGCGEMGKEIQQDHIIPVHAGGGLCWLSNYQPLCTDCHKLKTKADRLIY